MKIEELNVLREQLDELVRRRFPGYSIRADIGYPDSPNPVCVFEADGRYFIQGSFWANSEYRIDFIDNVCTSEIESESGMYYTASEAVEVVERICSLLEER